MSLRDLDVFPPLGEDHPLVRDGRKCWICEKPIVRGTRTGLVARETPEEAGSSSVEAEIVCGTCKLRGKRIRTPEGPRIVETVKEGDGSPFPVITTDGCQWRDEEVFPEAGRA